MNTNQHSWCISSRVDANYNHSVDPLGMFITDYTRIYVFYVGDINEENAKELLIQLENDIHLDYNPIQLDTIEIELENDMRAIEMTPSDLENDLRAIEIDPMNSDRLRGEMPNAPGAMVLTTHNIPYDYLHT